ncbi:MAG: alkaline phosphatase family protein [Planctomycetota bacterium]
MRVALLILAVVTFARLASPQDSQPVGRGERGIVRVPTHQWLQPMGHQVEFPGRPTDLLLLDKGATIAVKNKDDLVFIEVASRTIRQTLRVPENGLSYHGLAASPDRVYVTGSHDKLWVARREGGVASWDGAVSLPGPGGRGPSAPGGIALSGNTLYVALSRNNALGIVDLEARALVAEIPLGVAPYAVLLHEGIACVSNWGGRHPSTGDTTDPSSGTPAVVDPVTNVAASGTVSLVDLAQGHTVAEIGVGLHPCDLALDAERSLLYVANANADTVSVIDLRTRALARTLDVRPDGELPFGSAPNALVLAPDGKRLYVANGANNAVAVLDPLAASPLLGCFPVGWYPGALALDSRRGWLFVANVKGVGSLHPPTERAAHNSHDHAGSVSILTDLSPEALERGTRIVARTNRHEDLQAHLQPPDPNARPLPVPLRHGEPSVFEHVIYIIKENRTYDQVLGDQPRGNGDPSLCVFGHEVTPNHHAITDEFVLLDNFYCSGVLSADGHQWTDEAFVTDYIEKMFGGFVRSYPFEGSDPLAYAPTGFLWDNVLRHGKTFRCYGEMVQPSITPRGTFKEIYDDFIAGTGRFTIRGTSFIDAIRANMCETFIGFPNTVPDVYRAAEFVKELEVFEERGTFPNLAIMLLPNDHTSGTHPGMPTPEAAVADNDLALGRIVAAVTRSRFWKKTCIFVVQDDPQAGWDHVDAHRTVALVVSPYTKRGTVVSTRYTQPGMVKTIELILGLPPMNQMDLLATPMGDCFTVVPDFTPYTCRENKIPLDRLNASLDQLDGPALLDAVASLELDLEDVDRADEDTLNRILWRAAKGPDVPYPAVPNPAPRAGDTEGD